MRCSRCIYAEYVLSNGENASILDVFGSSVVVIMPTLALLVKSVGMLDTEIKTCRAPITIANI